MTSQKPSTDEQFGGQVAIVTGASRGIGSAIAKRLSYDGTAVAVNYASSEDAANEVVSDIEAADGRAVALQADVCEPIETADLFDATIDEFGHVDTLVNNAGVSIREPTAEMNEPDFEQMYDVNVKGTYFACQQAARKLEDGGNIINLSTSATKMMIPAYGAYAGTKAAVEQITRSLSQELGERDIRVNVVAPGPTNTKLFGANKTDDEIDRYASMNPFGRLGRPEDTADVVALLCSADAEWISGQVIQVNGAMA
jgi:3-oxoacyl-[acyl-carrier protein] reductase